MTTEVSIMTVPCKGKGIKIFQEYQNSSGKWERVVAPEATIISNNTDTYRNHIWNTGGAKRLVIEEIDVVVEEVLTSKDT